MAKTAKRSTLKFGDATPNLAAKGYVKCPTCRRDVRDAEAHAALHKNGTLGDDGKRTDRSKAEAERLANRWNGSGDEAGRIRATTKATKRAKKAKAKATKSAAKKVAAKKAA